jgi:hypothetical protein
MICGVRSDRTPALAADAESVEACGRAVHLVQAAVDAAISGIGPSEARRRDPDFAHAREPREREDEPHGFQDAKGPCSRQKTVQAGQGTSRGEPEDEDGPAMLQPIHEHRERQRPHSVHGDPVHEEDCRERDRTRALELLLEIFRHHEGSRRKRHRGCDMPAQDAARFNAITTLTGSP